MFTMNLQIVDRVEEDNCKLFWLDFSYHWYYQQGL
jgi:hypothetical protein